MFAQRNLFVNQYPLTIQISSPTIMWSVFICDQEYFGEFFYQNGGTVKQYPKFGQKVKENT